MGILFKSDKDKIDKDKHEAAAVPVEPATSATSAPVFLKRNLQNRAIRPEALEEEFEISNGLVDRVSNNPNRVRPDLKLQIYA